MGMQQPVSKDKVLDETLRREELESRTVTPDDWASFMGQVYFLIKDDELQAQLRDDPDMKVLMPVLSSLVRTGNLTKKTIAMSKLRWRIACRMQLLCSKEPEVANISKFYSWLTHGEAALEDALQGWRGRLVTERIKTYRIEGERRKRGRFLGLFNR